MNKQRLIRLLGTYIVAAGLEVHHAQADADTLIVGIALEEMAL